MAVRILEPDEWNRTLQLPFPPISVMVQFVSAPLMTTVPVGTVPEPLTVTLTDTDWPGADGSGVSAVIVVKLEALDPNTAWLSVSELLK
jgi:hypothetical protein